MIDAHIHADRYASYRIEAYIDTWRKAGVEGIIAVATDLASSYRTLELQQRFPDFVFAALGHHPEQLPPAGRDAAELFQLIEKEAKSGSIAAIGEVGLPHYSLPQNPDSLARHRELLDEFVRLAVRLDMPLALHAVHDKAVDALQILRRHNAVKAHFHWFKGHDQDVLAIVREGYFISVTPEVCYRQRDQRLLSLVPIGQLLVETDGPWPFGGPFVGIETTPLLLENTVSCAAVHKKLSTRELKTITRDNTLRLYKRTKVD
ncbi:TatD family hydrolase [Paenibacillus xerothermodurans]|uniref:TatD family deoxyribonuclease n=1 Tax=Paenibacillus xerothermodurans TaxID=1977292 RepID=A0A2W1N9Y4_PAEXE|nr:TatD family hydrolase [Paenibacillus xerothermodurans]PZE21227.1 TatD family deoxyribonuclease [Paenibacillus xerothermodurans]